MKKKIVEHFIEELEMEYEYHPRVFWLIFLTVMLVFFIFQSYIAQPRPIAVMFRDMWDISLVFFLMIYIFWSSKIRNLLIFGLVYLLLAILMWFNLIDFIKPAYGTLLFLISLWYLGDWMNFKKHGRSIFSELLKGNYYLAFGIFLSTLLLGG